jgi:hypothetical protein
MARKFLWIVDVQNQTDVARLTSNAQTIGAFAVVVNTKNPLLNKAMIDQFHQLGIQVYGWRWPAVVPQPRSTTHYFALDEAQFVLNLIADGLDGYIVDPEADDDPHASNFWNNSALKPLAAQFAATIRAAGGAQFHFGITSGCSYPNTNSRPNIPWQEFLAVCDAGYPQSYWRADLGGIISINGGNPAAAIQRGMQSWQNVVPAGKSIIPMAGELKQITPDEIAAFGAAMAAQGITNLHFYTDEPGVPQANYAKIATL